MKKHLLSLLVTVSLLSIGSTPTVKVATPDEPIDISLNAKMEHQISIKVDKALDDLFDANDDFF